jgi:hypothetical protein
VRARERVARVGNVWVRVLLCRWTKPGNLRPGTFPDTRLRRIRFKRLMIHFDAHAFLLVGNLLEGANVVREQNPTLTNQEWGTRLITSEKKERLFDSEAQRSSRSVWIFPRIGGAPL